MKKNRSDRGKPHVISGHAGFKEGQDPEYVEGSAATLDSWVIAAVSDHDDQKKRDQTFHYLQEIFRYRVDDDIVHAVLAECKWQGEEAIERLLELFPSTEETAVVRENNPQSRFTLRAVAESWLRGVSSEIAPELAQTGALCSTTQSQWAPLSTGSHALEKTLPISAHHSAAYSDVVKAPKSGNLLDRSCISKLRDQQLEVPDFSFQSKAIKAHSSLFVTDSSNVAAKKNSFSRPEPFGSQRRCTLEPSLEPLGDKNEIYFSDDDDETYSASTCDTTRRPAVNMNSAWSNYVQPDSKVATRSLPSSYSGVETGNANPVPATSHGLSAEQVRYLLSSTPTSDYQHKDLSNKDFVMPHLPVQVRNSPTESRSMRLRSPVFSPEKLDAAQGMPRSMFTPRALYYPSAGLTSSALPTFSAKAEGKGANVTIMSTEAARQKILGLLQQNRKVMILMRGCPGSGKTTLARKVQFTGEVFSADAFFERNGKYKYDPAKIGDAHAQTKQRALFAIKKGVSPVIIDNTNTQAWEMLPYVEMAVDYDYHVEVIEPDVTWRLKASQLAKLSLHGVPADKVAAMVERYEHNVTAKKLVDAVHSSRRLLSEARSTVDHLAASSLPQPRLQPQPLRQQEQLLMQPQLPLTQSQQALMMPQRQLLVQHQQLFMQPQQSLMQPQQSLMQPQQPMVQPQTPVQTQSTQREEELDQKKLSKSARKRLLRQVKKNMAKDPEMSPPPAAAAVVAAAAAAASCGSSENESGKKEDTCVVSDAGSTKQDPVQYQLFPPDVANPFGAPVLSSFASHKDQLLPQNRTSVVTGASESEEKMRLQLNVKDNTNCNRRMPENSSEVLAQITAPETCNRMASGKVASSEVGLSSNQFRSSSQMEQRPDLEIFEEEETEVASSGSVSPPDSSSFSNPLRNLDNQEEVRSLSSTGDIDSLNDSSHFDALDRFTEYAEARHTAFCKDSEFTKNREKVSRNQLPSAMTTSSVELDYWGRKGTIDNPYSIQGSQKAFGESSWSEQDSGDSVSVTSDSCSNRSVNPLPQRNLKERKLGGTKTTDAQVKVAGSDNKSSVDGWTAASEQHDVMFTLPSINVVSPVRVSRFSELPKKESQDGSSQTEASDLAAVYRLERGEHFEASLFSCVLAAKPRAIIDRELAIWSQMELDKRIVSVSKRDDSTMTDDLDDGNIDANMAFLSSCFPTVVHDDLRYILHGCGNDTDLTANILLDSGYEYNRPNHSAVSPCKASSTNPSSGDEDPLVKQTPLNDIQRKVGVRLSRAPVSYTLCRDSVKPKVVPYVESPRGGRRGQGPGRVEEKYDSPRPQQPSSSSADDEKITMSLTPGFAAQLVDLFGPLHSSSPYGLMPDSGLSVNLSFELAKQIYDSWMVTQKEMQTNPRNMTKNISSGSSQAQASAAWMEENCKFLSPKRIKDLDSLSEFTDISRQLTFARDVDEIFPALSPTRPMKTPETKTDSCLSTKIKRQQLTERYPMINATILDEIYEATGFSYDITVKTIGCCPELIAPPKVVMTKKKAEELELQLIQRAIEESVRDQISEGARKAVRSADCDEVYEDIMSEACRCFDRYQENLQKAQEAHCKKLHPVAMHYSEEAGRYKDKFRETQQMAAEMIMKNRLSDLSSRGSIDLHGFSVQEALHLLQQSLSFREDELLERYDKRRVFLNVITGRGSHSHRKVARIKPAVEAYLTRNNYEFVESTPAVLKVRLHVGF